MFRKRPQYRQWYPVPLLDVSGYPRLRIHPGNDFRKHSLLGLPGRSYITTGHPTAHRDVGGWPPVIVRQRRMAADHAQEESARRLPRRKVAARAADQEQGSSTVISIEVPTSTTSKRAAKTAAAATGPLPSPMDSLPTTFSDDASGKCPAFIQSFLADNTFKSCYPFSMLLQGGSNGFFDAQKSLVSLTQVLDASCKADVKMCTSWLADLTDQFQQDGNCGPELASGNTVVQKAYQGLKAYQPLYSATCLKEPESQAYCYATAATDTKDFSSVYPLLPTPEQEHAGFGHARLRLSSIAATYESGSTVMNRVCGAEYVNSTLPVATENAAVTMQQAPVLILFSFLVMAFTHLFL
ncbi:hypothetical protein PG994_010167 [Apiospora phragmitis]|uniref:DUF7729 domain-containing protein n=1 Tax=Apiospora phragmitis TaxID=2905665 RepID=A0ABR1TPA8_9PEZI